MPHKYLYLRLLSISPGSNINTWKNLEVSRLKTTQRDNFKQHPGIYSRNYHHLGRHHRGAHEQGKFCTSLIWKLHSHRMDLQVKLWQGQTISTIHICKMLETIVINIEICIYGENFKGICNIITDNLSRNNHLPDDQLTCLIFSVFPN